VVRRRRGKRRREGLKGVAGAVVTEAAVVVADWSATLSVYVLQQ